MCHEYEQTSLFVLPEMKEDAVDVKTRSSSFLLVMEIWKENLVCHIE